MVGEQHRTRSSCRRRSRRCSRRASTSFRPAERAALERGAVEGQVFHRGAVAGARAGRPGRSRAPARARAQGARPADAGDAARRRCLPLPPPADPRRRLRGAAEVRARRAPRALRRRGSRSAGADLVELDEILGYHLEQAALYREELGDSSPELARRAALRLGAAGRRAGERQDIHAALRLFRRALALAARGRPGRGRDAARLRSRPLHVR